jgi:hypothetical protein
MAVVQGVKEKVHLPIYDSVNVDSEKRLGEIEKSSTLKFFVDVQNKTKLETNLQSASLLPHYNTFEARAMRIVISDLKPKFPSDKDVDVTNEKTDATIDVVDGDGDPLGYANGAVVTKANVDDTNQVSAKLTMGLDDAVDLMQQADSDSEGTTTLDLDDDFVTDLTVGGTSLDDPAIAALTAAGGEIDLDVGTLQDFVEQGLPADQVPLDEQVFPNNGAGTLVGRFVYNTVASLYVGEKLMIQMPTWFFPAGAGVWNQSGNEVTHGEPSPLATFRFAEPIYIDKQQNFRVELEIPDSEVFQDFKRIYGPFIVWVVLDGYMTRDVQ